MTGATESPRRRNAGDKRDDNRREPFSESRIPPAAAPVNAQTIAKALACPTCNRPPTCRKCHLPITYYAAMGTWWCGTNSCPDRPSPPAPFTRATGAQTPSDGQGPPVVSEAVLVALADVRPETVRWLWPRRILLGKLTILAGPPGVGKSFALLDIAARVSRGALLPDGEEAPQGDVILLTAEDGLGDTVRPRLDLLGADTRRVYALTMVLQGQDERMFSLEEHLKLLERAITEKGAILAVIDPLLAYTGRADSYKESDVRGLLAPVAAMAERTACAVVGVIHLNKRGGEHSPLNRITASLAFVAQTRSVLLLAADPEDETGQRRILAPVKMNLCAHPPSLAFHFSEDGGLIWDGPVATNAADLLALPADRGERGQLTEAEDFLRDLLADGPVEAEKVKHEARLAGIAERTLWRGKASLGVTARREGFGAKGRSLWEMPTTAHSMPTAHSTPSCHTMETWQSMGGPDTKLESEAERLAEYGGDATAPAPICPHRPPGEVEDRWRHGDGGEVSQVAGEVSQPFRYEKATSDTSDGFPTPRDTADETDDNVPPELTGQRHLLVALGMGLGFPRVVWPSDGSARGEDGISGDRFHYEQAARFFTDADIEKAVAALEAMKGTRP